MSQYMEYAQIAYGHALANYGAKDARYDVIVECMGVADIAAEMAAAGVEMSHLAARAWTDKVARIQHEAELNVVWDGPESCVDSSKYDSREEW